MKTVRNNIKQRCGTSNGSPKLKKTKNKTQVNGALPTEPTAGGPYFSRDLPDSGIPHSVHSASNMAPL